MALFDEIFDIAKTRDSLDEYLKYHMADINDFYNLPYEDLKQEIGFIELFILKKRGL